MPSTADASTGGNAGDDGDDGDGGDSSTTWDSVSLSRRQLLGVSGGALALGGGAGYVLGARPFEPPACDASPLSAEVDEWPFPNHDRRHTSAAPARAAPDTFDERWHVEWDGGVDKYGTPTVANDRVFVATESVIGTTIHVLDHQTGQERWQRSFPDVFDAKAPVAAGDTVYYLTNTDENGLTLFALAVSDGRVRWIHSVEEYHSYAPPLIPSEGVAIRDDVAVETDASRLYALDVRTGEQCWETILDEDGLSPLPAAADGRVYFASRGTSPDDEPIPGTLFELDPETGETTWRTEIPHGVDGPPVLGDGVAYLAMFNGPLVAVSLDTGEEVWRDEQTKLFGEGEAGRKYAQPSYELGALTSDALVATLNAYTDASERIRAFDPETGEMLWERIAERDVRWFTTPTAAGTDAFVAEHRGDDDVSNRLLRLDARTGAVRETFTFESGVRHPPVFADGSAVFATGDGIRMFRD
ncbi:outer membrane protein assembly factor BamB family protein [Haloferax larsenii]|uniref:Outer membrane protein assembly factor BamB, contains PQQ-like beta-propeller repeat n=1 Tax=Haloferax larsenii TaxID=302484 RepID=A0A1H7TG21_HALLR|nr:PQQ-binding-like beta-propeller repeat protein [Haloferax larsenii]SEL83515.1 Outer membrane protein assembly factor BamB, contains PQQ-like beta-propeller repeat [Haloferax larsenii]